MRSFGHHAFLLFIKHAASSCRALSSKVKYTASLDPAVEELLKDGLKAKHHPGIRTRTCIQLPKRLEEAATRVLKKYERKELETNSETFVKHINGRLQPVDDFQVKDKLKEFREIMTMKEKVPLENLDEEARQKAEERIKNRSLKRLHILLSYWKPIAYNEYQCYLYLYGKLASNFAVLKKVFADIKGELPSFTPKTVFDFGSGVGTVIWAVTDAWGESAGEYFCVDASAEMNDMARLLLQDGKADKDPFLKGLFFRQFLPSSTNIGYDLVVCAWSLLDLPSIQKRIEVIENLWSRTQHLLVLIEYGSTAGYSTVLEARDYILNKSAKTGIFARSQGDVQPASVVCPCPHDMACPRYLDNSGTACHFSVKYLKFNLKNSMDVGKEKFSYVVLKKEFRTENEEHWPRIVQEVLKCPGHTICRMCCNNGQLSEVIFTKAKHTKEMYRCARNSKWGDLLPAKVYERPPDADDEGDLTAAEEPSDIDEQDALKT